MRLNGIYCPMVTPFKKGAVDLVGLAGNVAFLEEGGISGLVPLGSAGEFPSLSMREKREVIKKVLDTASVPVIVGATSTRIEEALETIAYSADLGAEVALVAPPYYLKTNQEGLFSYYSELASRSKLPVMLYNIPAFTGNPLLPPLVKRLSGIDNIIGIKDTSGDMENFQVMACTVPKGLSIFIGWDHMLLPALVSGASGAITGSSNLVPGLLVEIFQTWKKNIEKAAELQRRLMYVVEILGVGTFPAGLKYAMDQRGLAGGEVRTPLLGLTVEEKSRVDGLLVKLEAGK